MQSRCYAAQRRLRCAVSVILSMQYAVALVLRSSSWSERATAPTLDRSIDGNGSLAGCHAKTERMP
jgi:hypothetical protein